MSDADNYRTMLKQNKKKLLAVLLMPVIGMIIAIPLILWKAPKRIIVAGGVIFFIMFQYILLVWWISKKIDQIIESPELGKVELEK